MNNNLEKIIEFLRIVGQLKFTYRYSTNKYLNNESTAAHTWSLMLLSLMIKKELDLEVDELKLLKIALMHDLAESITGDIDSTLIAEGTENQEDKDAAEKKAMKELGDKLSSDLKKEIFKYWTLYQEQTCKEAKIVKTLDKVEAQLHLLSKMPRSFMNEKKAD